jgi:ABC-2 type transport system ATP-binding protein
MSGTRTSARCPKVSGNAWDLLRNAPILILDEPTSGLDPNQIVEIRNLIKQLGRAKTVILSTHILSEVQATCDRVLIINEGKIVADGSPEQLQRDFHGTDALTLELRTGEHRPLEDVLPRLRSVPQVSGARILSQDGATGTYELQTEKGQDAREAVFRLAVAEGWIILEMHRRVTSLEEVFHKLTTTES